MDYVIGLNERSQHPRSFKGDGYNATIAPHKYYVSEVRRVSYVSYHHYVTYVTKMTCIIMLFDLLSSEKKQYTQRN